MDRNSSSSPTRHELTRRGLLAVVGTSAIAGCSSLSERTGGSKSTIRVYDLPDINKESVPEPIVPPSLPIEVAPKQFATARDRVNTLLSSLPTPLGPTEIPNGHIRQHLTDAADEATDGLDKARIARTNLQALQSLQRARKHARYASAGWAVADQGQSISPLRREYRQTLSKARSFRNSHEYIGEDLVRAALVHAYIENTLNRIVDTTRPRTDDEGQLLTVAEWGETAESAQASLDDTRHLAEQFAGSLSDDAGTVDGILTRTAETLLADSQSRRTELPPEPTTSDWGVAENVRNHIRRRVNDGTNSVIASIGPARAVIVATEQLAYLRAFDRVEERIEAGEITTVDTAKALREIRSTAYNELTTALEESPEPELARTVISDVSWLVTQADWELERINRDVSPERLDDTVADYFIATAVARVVPAACRQTADALESN